MINETREIPLNKLASWEGNVRKTNPDTGLDELAASITAHGLLQSLVVRKKGKTGYTVIAGNRRLQALQKLVANDTIPVDYPVSCRIMGSASDAAEISLTENTVREQMHPADEFDAFRALIDKGLPPADVAARFGVTETVVLKRLKLARVSPAVLEAYRQQGLTLEQVIAFAVSDDHAAQEELLANLSHWNDDPGDIREALTADEIPATDRRVRMVTLPVYEKAGGQTRRDLFADDENGIFILDPQLLDRLVMEKLQTLADEIQGEGWKWIECRPFHDYAEWSKFHRIHAQPVPFTAAQQEEYDALDSELDRFYDTEDELTDEQEARADTIRARMEELDDRDAVWSPEKIAGAGVIITINQEGIPDIRRGYVRPEDKHELAKKDPGKTEDTIPAVKKSEFSAALIEDLTTHKSAAIAACLAVEPEMALAATVHSMTLGIFYPAAQTHSCLEITANAQSLHPVKDSKAFLEIEHIKSKWQNTLPDDPVQLWKWCLKQRRDTLMDLLAICAACTVNAVQHKVDRSDSARLAHAHNLADSLTMNMGDYFTTGAQNYFLKISKAQLLSILEEIKGVPPAPATGNMKKAELAMLAERAANGTGWLPEIIRVYQDTPSKPENS